MIVIFTICSGLIGGHCNGAEDLQDIDDLIRYRRSSGKKVVSLYQLKNSLLSFNGHKTTLLSVSFFVCYLCLSL